MSECPDAKTPRPRSKGRQLFLHRLANERRDRYLPLVGHAVKVAEERVVDRDGGASHAITIASVMASGRMACDQTRRDIRLNHGYALLGGMGSEQLVDVDIGERGGSGRGVADDG